MGRVVVRIMGFASTSKGFAYAVLEGPKRLVGWKLLRLPSRRVPKALKTAFGKMRPLFVAFDLDAVSKKRGRGRLFRHFLSTACAADGTLLIPVSERSAAVKQPGRRRTTRWQVAADLAERFRELSFRLPARRKPWQSEDDRIGIFMALAAAVAAWRGFSAG